MVESVKSRFNSMDIIVNNAAIIAVDDLDKMLDINLVGLQHEVQ